MKENFAIDAINHIDNDLIEEYAKEKERLKRKRENKKRMPWVKWASLAACLCFACVLGAVGSSLLRNDRSDPTFETLEDVAYGFKLSEDSSVTYYPIGFSALKVYGLVDADATGLTEENKYRITEKDLGKLMGTVYYSEDRSLIGCKVYHFTKYPESESICIIEGPDGYEFYIQYTIEGIDPDKLIYPESETEET